MVGGNGLAIVRIDRVKDALDAGLPIAAGGVPVTLAIPPHGATSPFPRPPPRRRPDAPTEAGAPPRAWQRMLSGRRLDLLDPSPLDIEIADIAHGLARVARWNGQTSGRPCLLGRPALAAGRGDLLRRRCRRRRPTQRLAALLHDAPEYVIGDMISPFKSVVGGGYKEVEGRLQRADPPALRAAGRAAARRCATPIKRADQIAAYFEATVLAGFSVAEATRFFGRPRGISADRFDLTSRAAEPGAEALPSRASTRSRKRAER